MSAAGQSTDPPKFKVLILEDEPCAAEVLVNAIEREGGQVTLAGTLGDAKALLDGGTFDAFVLDNYLPDGKGSSLFSYLREKGISAPCILLTGQPEITTAVELTRDGLFDYLTKPLDLGRFLDCLRRAISNAAFRQANLEAFGIVDRSPGMKILRRLVYQAAANPETTVLLTGETGVGKDLIARLIHQLTFPKSDSTPPMISLNCSTLPADMFEAELFGAQKGAYTGAHYNRLGLVEAAQKGTLFLDEIAEIPLSLQAKLLQFLETREYRRLGSPTTFKFDGRIIAASNKWLESEVQQQRFRSDLWYRLDVFSITVPPLRERREDFQPLVDILLETLARKYQRIKPLLKPADMALLQDYSYPGNVRELRNVLERSLLLTAPDAKWLELDQSWIQKVREAGLRTTDAADGCPRGRELTPIEQQEYLLIRKTLLAERGHVRRTAAKLGISHQALLRRLEKWPELRVEKDRPLDPSHCEVTFE